MKRTIKFSLVIILAHGLSVCFAQNYSLEGHIKNFDGSSIQLHITKEHMGKAEAIDIPVTAGKFKYNGTNLKSPYFASLVLGPQQRLQFVLYNEPVKIQADAAHLPAATLTGGKQIEQYNQYRQTIGASARGTDDGNRNDRIVRFIEQNPTSGVSPYLLWANRLDMETKIRLYNSLDSNLLADNSYFKFITPSIVGQRNTAVGKPVPAMSQPDTSGNIVSLKDYEGRYFLIDFWASWCVPCRAANPGLVKLYNDYKDKNFTILGISLDRQRERDKWIAAIKEDGLTWDHVSDLNGWDNEISRAFGINSIPATVLIDSNGVIVARNLSEEQLRTLLDQKLK